MAHLPLLNMEPNDDVFEENDIPEATQNRWAMTIGYYSQSKTGQIILNINVVCLFIFFLSDAISKGEIPWELSTLGFFIASLLLCMLVWVVKNSPYDMLQKLRETIIAMRRFGTNLKNSNAELSREINQLKTVNQSIQTNNKSLNGLVDKLRNEIESSNIVRKGLESSMNTLLERVSSSHDELADIVKRIQNDLVTKSTETQFLEYITNLSTQITKVETLTDKLQKTTDANVNLSNDLMKLISQVDTLVDKLQDKTFTQHIEEIIRAADDLADNGLRDRLLGGDEISTVDRNALVDLFVHIDRVLKDEFREKQQQNSEIINGSREVIVSCRNAVVF